MSTTEANPYPDVSNISGVSVPGTTPGVFRLAQGLKLEKVLGKEEYRPILTYAWIYSVVETEGKGKNKTETTLVYMAATDSTVLARVPLDGELLEGQDCRLRDGNPIPVTKEALKAIQKQCRFEVSAEGDVKVGDVVYQAPQYATQGPPDVEALINEALNAKGEWNIEPGQKFDISFNSKKLVDLADALGANAPNQFTGKNVVHLEVAKPLAAILVRVGQSDEKVGLLMPVRRGV